MDKDEKAQEVVSRMLELDRFSEWLGVTLLSAKDGYSRIRMTVRPEMINGFGIAHGGIAFALADSAFAFACNSDGMVTVALDVSISFPKPVKDGDVLTAEAKRVQSGNTIGLYLIEVKNQQEVLVALFKGTCYKTKNPLS
jgi:acyl-CoA thioesterase